MSARASAPLPAAAVLPAGSDFSLVLGGPLFQLLRRTHLSDDLLSSAHRRIVVISLLAWLPLLVLSVMDGRALSGVHVPFLRDVEVQVRFLVALPLLIAAELVVHRRMQPMVTGFLDRHLIPPSAIARFESSLASAYRLRNSLLAEVMLVVFVYVVGVLIVWRHYTVLDTTSWYATSSAQGSTLSIAGMWYGYLSLPIFQFILCRWYFRLFIWIRFIWQVSRIELRLVPTHPDRVGGLGFLGNAVYAFALLAVAHGAIVAGQLGNRILFLGTSLPQYKAEIASVVVFTLCFVLGPLLMFAPQIAQAKRTGLREYGTLAERYVREFDAKWLRGGAPPDEPLVGSADIQSLADLGNSYEIIKGMRMAPLSRDTIVFVVIATLAPIAPLLLTLMPLEQLLKTLLGVLF